MSRSSLSSFQEFITHLTKMGDEYDQQKLEEISREIRLLLEIEQRHVHLIANLKKLSKSLIERSELQAKSLPKDPVMLAMQVEFRKLILTINNFILTVIETSVPQKTEELDSPVKGEAKVIFDDLMKRISQKPPR